jgi:hypothetical protein
VKGEAKLEKDPDTADVRSILGPRIPSTQISDYLEMETDVEESSGEEWRWKWTDPSVD